MDRWYEQGKNNVSLFSKLLLPKINNKANVKMIQLTLTLPKILNDREIDCSFLRNPHYSSVIMTYEVGSKLDQIHNRIENEGKEVAATTALDGSNDGEKIKLKGQFDRMFSCNIFLTGFTRQKAYNDHASVCSGSRTTHYQFMEEEYTYFQDQKKTDPPPFDIFFDTETPIDDDHCGEPSLLLGSYSIVVVFSDNILASKKNSLQNFTCFRSKKMTAIQAEKVLVPGFMIPSIKEEDYRAVKKASIRVLRKIA